MKQLLLSNYLHSIDIFERVNIIMHAWLQMRKYTKIRDKYHILTLT